MLALSRAFLLLLVISPASAQDGRFYYDADGNPLGSSTQGNFHSFDDFDENRAGSTGAIIAPERGRRNLDKSTDPLGEMAGSLLGDE